MRRSRSVSSVRRRAAGSTAPGAARTSPRTCCRSRPIRCPATRAGGVKPASRSPSATWRSAHPSWHVRRGSRASRRRRTGRTWSCTACCTCWVTITRKNATRPSWKRARCGYWRHSDTPIPMAEEPNSSTGRWLRRITDTFSGEPRDLESLNEVLAQAKGRGIIDPDAYEMLEGVLRVVELQVRDIMVPRSQMTIVNRDDPPEDILPVVIESGHSRFPVIGEDRDQIVGILLAKDLLRYFAEGGREDFDIKEVLRPVAFIPESKRLNVLLKEFRVSHHHMAVVVDEYGGVAGLVTIEDVLEQIVGDIGDEYDVEDDLDIRKEGERQFTVKAQTRIEDFNAYFSSDFSDEEFDTIGGLAMNFLGRLPRRGESFVLGGLEFKVMRADRRRLDTLRVVTAKDILRKED